MIDNETRQQKSRESAPPAPTPRIPDAEIRVKTVLEALQHPATMYPASLSIILAAYLLMLSPIFGGRLLAAGVCGISAVAAVWSYRSRYNKSLSVVSRQFKDHQKEEESRSEEVELDHLRDILHSGFLGIASKEGIKALSELVTEFEQLRPAMRDRRPMDPFSVSQIPALAAETYKRGMSVLSDALELIKVVQTPGKEKLEKDIAGLEQEAGLPPRDTVQAERAKLRKEQLESLKQRLEMVEGYQLYVDRLLSQARRCEAALYRTRLVLADGQANEGQTHLDNIVEMMSRNEVAIRSFTGFESDVSAVDKEGRRVAKQDIIGSGLAMKTSHPVQIFFIGIGTDADMEIGRILAQATGAEFQGVADKDLAKVLAEFSKYF